MAKKKINRTLYDLLHVDVNKLTNANISEYYKAARENIRKTVNRWEKRQYKSPAYYAFERATGGKLKPDFRGAKTLQEKKKELAKAIRFLKDPTRTIAGWEEEKQEQIKTLYNKTGILLNLDEYDLFYTAFDKGKELDPRIAHMDYKYDIMQYLTELIRSDVVLSVDEIAVKLHEKMDELYNNKEYQHQKNMEHWSQEFRNL